MRWKSDGDRHDGPPHGGEAAGTVPARRAIPRDADELLWMGQMAIAEGTPRAAEALARDFLRQAGKGKRIDMAEQYRRQAYAWYVLALAAYRVTLTRPKDEAHETLVFFFIAHKKTSWYFLKYLQSFEHGLRVTQRDTGIRDNVDRMHAAVYRTWGAGPAGRADLEANREVSF